MGEQIIQGITDKHDELLLDLSAHNQTDLLSNTILKSLCLTEYQMQQPIQLYPITDSTGCLIVTDSHSVRSHLYKKQASKKRSDQHSVIKRVPPKTAAECYGHPLGKLRSTLPTAKQNIATVERKVQETKNTRHYVATFQNTPLVAKSLDTYAGMQMDSSYSWEYFHLALEPNRNELYEQIVSIAIMYGHKVSDEFNNLLKTVYEQPCMTLDSCLFSKMRYIEDETENKRKGLILLPPLLYNLEFARKSRVHFTCWVEHGLNHIATYIRDPRRQKEYGINPRDQISVELITTFECTLCTLFKKMKSLTSNLFAMNINETIVGDNEGHIDPTENRDILPCPEHVTFDMPKIFTSETNDFRLLNSDIIIPSYKTHLLYHILAKHRLRRGESDRLVCLDKACANLKWYVSR